MRHRRARGGFVGAVAVLVLAGALAGPAFGQDDSEAQDALIAEGAEVYVATCAACHGPTGDGTSGVFPPLNGNPNVADTEYLAETIRSGRQGELVVDGVTYDGVMPPFVLSDGEIDAVVAFIGAGFEVPAGAQVEAAPAGGTAGTALPSISSSLYVIGFIAFAALGLWVFWADLAGPVGAETTWLAAWLKTAVIVVFFVGATVVIPSVAIQTSTVARLPRIVQDMVGAGLWGLGLVVGLGLLWWAKREKRI